MCYFTIIILIGKLFSAFDTTQSYGARSFAMGGAYTALSDTPEAININPAGISQIKKFSVSFTNTKFYDISELQDNYIAFVYPDGYNSYGFSLKRFNLSKIYIENTQTFSYSREISQKNSLGFNLKLFSISAPGYSNDPAYKGTTFFYSFDFGYLTKLLPQLNFGIFSENINSPQFKILASPEVDKLYNEWKIGLAYLPYSNTTMLFDLKTEKGKFKNFEDNFQFGSEINFGDVFAIRLGIDRGNMTAGLGLFLKFATLDWGFYNNKNLGIVNRISIVIKG